jgi:hypothetical protein
MRPPEIDICVMTGARPKPPRNLGRRLQVRVGNTFEVPLVTAN